MDIMGDIFKGILTKPTPATPATPPLGSGGYTPIKANSFHSANQYEQQMAKEDALQQALTKSGASGVPTAEKAGGTDKAMELLSHVLVGLFGKNG